MVGICQVDVSGVSVCVGYGPSHMFDLINVWLLRKLISMNAFLTPIILENKEF